MPEVGKGAVEGKYRKVIDTKDGRCTGSVDLDAACKAEEPGANRWDYGLGFKKVDKPELAIWVEPHSGSSAGEVKAVLAKLDWLEAKLALKPFADLRALTGTRFQDWDLPESAGLRLDAVRPIRDAIKARVLVLLEELNAPAAA